MAQVGNCEVERSLNVGIAVYAPTLVGTANFTGTPTAPTAAAGTNTTQIATTAFVINAFK